MTKPEIIQRYILRYLEQLNSLAKKVSEEQRALLPEHVVSKQEINVFLTEETGIAIDYAGIAGKQSITFQESSLSFDDLIFPPTNPRVAPEIGALALNPIKAGRPDEPTRTIKLMGSMKGIVLFKIDNRHIFAYDPKIMAINEGRFAFFNIYAQRVYADTRVRSRYVRYAELFPEKDALFTVANADMNAAKDFEDLLEFLKSPDMSPNFQKYLKIGDVVQSLKQDSVCVLGKDSPPEIGVLREIQSELKLMNYNAFLVRDQQDLPGQTPEEKAKLLSLMSKFCVMEDSRASGHIAEFEYCKNNRVVLILLRRAGQGSTWMIGDAGLVDINFIKTFEYSEDNVHEVLLAGTQWAEEFLKRRVEAYHDYLP